MKRALLILFALLLMQDSSPAQGTVSFGIFYSSLDPYGEWIPLDGGVYGWRPVRVVGDWRPYAMGQWAWTSDGWYWASEEPWGWATYHYGRWYYDDFYGWIWIPGYDWAPAWVEWRYGGDYIGWAPLGPYAIWGFHAGIRYRHHWVTPYHWWSFVDCRYITSPGIHNHMYRTEENQRFIGRTRSGGNVRYRDGRIVTRGPDRDFVERRGRIRLQSTEVVEGRDRGERLTREGNRDRIEVYRPRIEDRQVDMIEKPSRIREGDRRVGLETGNLDVRARSIERSTGRDPGKAEEYRRQRREESVRPTPGKPEERNLERKRPDRPSGEQRQGYERPASRAPEGFERPAPRPTEQPRQAPKVERPRPPKQQEMRSSTPERTTRRSSEARPERSRSGGGREKR